MPLVLLCLCKKDRFFSLNEYILSRPLLGLALLYLRAARINFLAAYLFYRRIFHVYNKRYKSDL